MASWNAFGKHDANFPAAPAKVTQSGKSTKDRAMQLINFFAVFCCGFGFGQFKIWSMLPHLFHTHMPNWHSNRKKQQMTFAEKVNCRGAHATVEVMI